MKELSAFFIAIIVILLIVFWPLAVIWGLNTLFALNIAYTFWTWLAVIVLTCTLSARTSKSSS